MARVDPHFFSAMVLFLGKIGRKVEPRRLGVTKFSPSMLVCFDVDGFSESYQVEAAVEGQ